MRYALLFITVISLSACRDRAKDDARALAASMRDLAGPYKTLDDAHYPPVSNSTTQPVAPDVAWQPLDYRAGELSFGSASLDFMPRSTHWRFTFTSDRTPEATSRNGQDHSYLKVNLWMGQRDARGEIGLRAVRLGAERTVAGAKLTPVHAKGKGGDGGMMEFDSGLFPDGTPRPFRITVSGNCINYQLNVEDLGPQATPAVKPMPTQP